VRGNPNGLLSPESHKLAPSTQELPCFREVYYRPLIKVSKKLTQYQDEGYERYAPENMSSPLFSVSSSRLFDVSPVLPRSERSLPVI